MSLSGAQRLAAVFERLSSEGRKALVPYITAGDPDLDTTSELLEALVGGGADIIELGVPFSDPMADGPVLQKAAERALTRPVPLHEILDRVRTFSLHSDVPVILFGYYNPFFRFGVERLARRLAEAGGCGVLCVDLPPEEAEPLVEALRNHGLAFVPLVTPVSGPDRIAKARAVADAFGYYVSVTGVTGVELSGRSPTEERVREVRAQLDRPVVVGFGVRTPEDAARLGRGADGVVVGSALVDLAHRSPPGLRSSRVSAFLAQLKGVV